jgi:tRNA A-37 threonylcarbamoyl transferase component Bud32
VYVDQQLDLGEHPPRRIAGRYRLVRALGQGGMGRVWLAHDEMLRRDVAVKELVPSSSPSSADQREMHERVMREARAIARLDHANVVRILDVLHVDGEPWIVMEFVASRSLQQVLVEDGPLAPAQAARIGLAVLAALRAAHRAGLLHRDVKPANVLLAEDGRVVLTDFGLATTPEDPSLTQAGMVLGSPEYLAPERAVAGVVGPAADLWSLGATLYATVEGRPPYARASTLATLTAIATEPPTPAARAGAMAPLLQGLLRKNPGRRIGAEEAERLLRRVAAQHPSPSATAVPASRAPVPPESPQQQALDTPETIVAAAITAGSRAHRARRLLIVAVLIAAALLAGGLTASRLPLASPGSSPARAAAPATPAHARAPATTDPTTAPTSTPTTAPTRSPAAAGLRAPTGSPAATGTATTSPVPARLTPIAAEAEDPGNVLTAPAQAVACAACYGGYRVRYLGGTGKVSVTTQIPVSGPRTLTVAYETDGQREIKINSNGALILIRTVTGSNWDVPQTFSFTTVLNAGPTVLTFYNDTSPAPDIDQITIS